MIYVDMLGSKPFYYRSKTEYGFGLPSVSTDEQVITQNIAYFREYQSKGFQTFLLSDFLSIPNCIGIYEVFSFFFDGKVTSDFEMIEAIFNGLILPSEYCFCFCVNMTFCWFTVSDGNVKESGRLQYSYDRSRFSVGKFMKRLNYEVAKSCFNLSRIKFLFWGTDDALPEFLPYVVNYDLLSDFFNGIDGLKYINMVGVMQLLSNDLKDRYLATAWDFVSCLADGAQLLGLRQQDGILYANKVYYKDFSKTIGSGLINKKGCTFGIILDCEGTASGYIQDGLSAIGGIIYCKYDRVLLNVEMFISDVKSFADTLHQAIENTRDLMDLAPFQNKRIKVFTYGSNDKIMLESSLSAISAKNRKVIMNQLSFIDVKQLAQDFVKENKLVVDGGMSLNNIAMTMGVQVVKPLHNPANDARTLFNVLAKMLRETNKLDILL